MTFIDRFFSKTKLNTSNNCIEWIAARNSDGYGLICNPSEGKPRLAHRIIFELFNESFSKSALICHRCDNPSCVNPNHLFQGSDITNTLDKVAKGRQSCLKGKSNGNAKLTDVKVVKIRSLYASGKFTQKDLAEKFKITQTAIGNIVTGKKWKHV